MTGTTAAAKRAERHDPSLRGVVRPAPSALDLHTHTLRSDGLLTASELATAARAAGVRLLAITDHDNLAGFRELRDAAIPAGLELLPGVELNAVMGDRPELAESEVHVLGLGVDPDDEAFEATLGRQRDQRRIRFGRMVRRLGELGLPVEAALAEMPESGDDDALGRPTIARAMIALGYVESVEDAFSRFLSRGRPGYVPRGGLGPTGAVTAIRRAGGVPVLAHFAEAPLRLDLLRELIDCGLLGIEAHHASFEEPTVRAVTAVAGELGLLVTGGTDYHGDLETYAEAHARLWVPPEVEAPLRRAMALASPSPAS